MSGPSAGRNRLAEEVSPYLLLHQNNPVDWYPWGEEALERARKEDKPIFLSVGYSTCYWCHVMERESFSDPQIAEVMNRSFINIKLDREERPELDEIYMAATQILTHQGGWPNSVFLTPQLMPYFAGTYFPPEGRHGLPSFRQVLESMSDAWRSRREDVGEQARELEGAMRKFLEERGDPADHPPPAEVTESSLEALAKRFDARCGGFGSAPKFPSPGNLFLLLELAGSRPDAARMLEVTLDRMARGGIYDQLAGGFHRYATDSEWKVPHFEKMLYDNGLLLEVYARETERTGGVESERIVRETAAFLQREMTAPEGGFWSAIDAETDGREGAYYVWSLPDLEHVLGSEDSIFLAPLYGFDRAPFFEGNEYVLHLPLSLEEQAKRRRLDREQLLQQLIPLRERLFAARSQRDRPPTDDKVLTDWNGMAISGLATAGRVLADRSLIECARRAAEFIWQHLRPDGGPLLHSWRAGAAKNPAYLSDYVFFIRGLLSLHEATRDGLWLTRAVELADEQSHRLADPRGGFFVAGEHPDLLFRSREVFDGALPSSNAMAALNSLELAHRTDDRRWLQQAERLLKAFALIIEQRPDGARMLSLATARYFAAVGVSADRPSPAAAFVNDPLIEEAQKVVTATSAVVGDPSDWQKIRVEVAIVDGWYLYAPGGTGSVLGIPLELKVEGGELRAINYPAGREHDGVLVYESVVEIHAEFRAISAPRLVLKVQPCDATRCLPAIEVEVSFPSTTAV